MDYSYIPRANDINENTRTARETTILINIVRASRSEPLNFVALSKYTGAGQLGASESWLRSDTYAIGKPAATFLNLGSFTTGVSSSAQNSFDVGTLENRDFYGGFLAPLDLQSLNLLLNAGLDREIVFHSVMRSFRVVKNGVPFLFENNPADDRYNGIALAPQCEALYDGTERAFEPVFGTPIWRRPHEQDCRYQKFLYFLRLAVRYGVTVEAIPLAQASQKSGGGFQGQGGGGGGGGGSQTAPVADYLVCYDPAIANENHLPQAWNGRGACGSKVRVSSKTQEFDFRFTLPPGIQQILPVIRSPYGVFQFYGSLLQRRLAHRVRLSQANLRERGPRERPLVTILEEEGFDNCFVSASYGGTRYCVPNDGTMNTKQIFVLLNTLVAMSINRSALPVSPTFVLTP